MYTIKSTKREVRTKKEIPCYKSGEEVSFRCSKFTAPGGMFLFRPRRTTFMTASSGSLKRISVVPCPGGQRIVVVGAFVKNLWVSRNGTTHTKMLGSRQGNLKKTQIFLSNNKILLFLGNI